MLKKYEMHIKDSPTKAWHTRRLGDLGLVLIGLTYSPKDITSDGVLVFRSSNIKNKKINYDDQVRVREDLITEKNLALEGDILICARNGSRKLIGKNALITKKDTGNAFGAFMSVFRTSHYKYIHQLFQSEVYRREIERDLGPTINQVTTGNLLRFKFAFPKEKEQKHIVMILEIWDEYLGLLDKKIELTKNIKRALTEQIFAQRVRLENKNGVGYPDWISRSLLNLCQISTGKKDVNEGNPEGQYPFFTCARGSTYSDSYSYDTEAILIAGNADVGHCQYYKGKFEAYQRTYILAHFDKINTQYLFYFLEFYFHRKIASLKQQGAMSYLKLAMLEEFMIQIPVKKEQEEISGILLTIDEQISLLEDKRDIIEKQREYCLNNLVTGKIRTPENLKTTPRVNS